MLREWIWITHFGTTCALTGISWLVLLVTYPAMSLVGPDQWTIYHHHHTSSIVWLVAPLMLTELGTALWLGVTKARQGTGGGWKPWRACGMGWVLLAGIWALTFGVLVPQHQQLAEAWQPEIAAAMLTAHGWRTALWSGRTCLIALDWRTELLGRIGGYGTL